MSDVETALMLRLEASLAKFEKQMSRGQRVVNDFTKDWDNKFGASNRKMAKTAEKSAQTIGKEMDRLRAKYDPLFAASKKYEASLNELNRAQKVGALSSQQYDTALENLNAEYARATNGAKGVGKAARGMGGGIQNAAYQIGDFAVQVGAGTSASMALGQQLPQLLGGFGVLGAVLGAVVAIAVPLAGSFFKSGEAAESLEDKIDDLKSAVQDYRSAVENAAVPTAEIAEKYGTATGAARDFLEALRDISKSTAITELEDATRALARQFGTFEDEALGGLQQMQGVTNLNETLKTIRSELELNEEQARSVAIALEDLGKARGPKQVSSAAQEVLSALEAALGPISEMDGEAKKLAESVSKAGLEADSLQRGIDGSLRTFSAAAVAADELSFTIAGISFDSAISGANSLAGKIGGMIGQAQTLLSVLGRAQQANLSAGNQRELAEAERDLVKSGADRVEVARKLAEIRKRQDLDAEIGVTLPVAAREKFIREAGDIAAATAEATAETVELRKARKDAEAEAKKAAKKDPIFEASEKDLQNIQRQIEMIGKTKAEIAELAAKYKLLDEAKERGLDLDARQVATGETLREQIDRQAASIGELTAKYDQAQERAAFFEGVQNDLKNGFIDAIVEGESLSGVLENLAKSLAKAALQAALFNEGPFASGSGGGLLGGLGGGGGGGLLGGAIIPGILHSGGTAGKDGYGHGRSVSPAVFKGAPRYHNGGIAGLRPNEVPAILERGERVIPNGQSGGGAAGGVVRVIIEEGPMFASTVRAEATGVAVEVTRQGIQENSRAQADNKYLRGGR